MAPGMRYRTVSADGHIDTTFCPPDLWSAQAPRKWKRQVPRVEERDDGLHWLIDGKDVGMWNGVAPAFRKYEKGRILRVDKLHAMGFYDGHSTGALPRATSPELRLADMDRDGLDAEIVYGLLGIGVQIRDGDLLAWVYRTYNDWALDFARRADERRVFPLA